ncbi:beta-lactamase family protein [Alteromonas sp. SM 2104]|nr:beta-lactamase family protein [Alteromonas oceanisediminis]
MVFYQQGEKPVVVVQGVTHRGGSKISPDTVFRLASVSKTFTGVLMAKMVAGQQLNWQTQLVELVEQPDFNSQYTDKLQLEHLIGQSSGYMPNAYDNLIEADYPVKRVLKQLADLEPLCSPGQCYTYQNALFGTLENYFSSQNTSYHRQLQTQLFDPLGMQTASAGKGALMSSSQWARPHIAIARNRWREGDVENNYYRFAPAAGVNASIADMSVWLRAMLGEYPNIVSPQLISDVTTPRVKTKRETYRRGWREHLKDAHYGLGWRVYDFEGYKLVYHGGWVKGYRADVSFSPETGAGFAMLINAESNMINYTTAELWSAHFEAFRTAQQREAASAQNNTP